MVSSSLIHFISLSLGCLTQNVYSTPLAPSSVVELKAARRTSDILRRSEEIYISHSAELRYTNGETHGAAFLSRVYIESHAPILVLEEFGHHLDYVVCNPSNIELRFASENSYAAASTVLPDLVGGYVITSHAGCNDEGARAPFQINSISRSGDLTFTLAATKMPWKDAFSTFRIDYSHTDEPHNHLNHDTLRKRDQATPTGGLASLTNLIPTSTPTATSVTLDLSYEEKDSTWSITDLSSGDDDDNDDDDDDDDDTDPTSTFISLGCNLCQVAGKAVLTQGEFNINNVSEAVDSVIDSSDIDISDVITSGTVQLALNDFSVHADLQLSLSQNGDTDYSLYQAPVLAIQISGVGVAGIVFEPLIHVNWNMTSAAEVSYGFDLKVPTGANVKLDLSHPDNSAVTGFDETTIEAIPFQSNITDVEMNLNIALRTKFNLAFEFFDFITLGAGPYLDLPSANVTISQLSTATVGSNCEPGSSIDASQYDETFQNFTHIVPTVGFNFGLTFQAEVEMPPAVPNINLDSSKVLLTKDLPDALPTACLATQKNGTFAPAETVLASVKKDKSKDSGAFSLSLEARGLGERTLGLGLVFIAALFAVL